MPRSKRPKRSERASRKKSSRRYRAPDAPPAPPAPPAVLCYIQWWRNPNDELIVSPACQNKDLLPLLAGRLNQNNTGQTSGRSNIAEGFHYYSINLSKEWPTDSPINNIYKAEILRTICEMLRQDDFHIRSISDKFGRKLCHVSFDWIKPTAPPLVPGGNTGSGTKRLFTEEVHTRVHTRGHGGSS